MVTWTEHFSAPDRRSAAATQRQVRNVFARSDMNLEELFGRYALCIDRPEDYIQWGEMQLLEGNDSMNVAILAGLDIPKPIDREEVYSYFHRCLKELNVEWPDQQAALKEYSKLLAKKIISKEVLPQKGLEQLSRLYRASDYSISLYSIWDELEEDISMLGTDYGPIFNAGLKKDNIDDFIVKQAIQYLELMKRPLPDNFFKLANCNTCNMIKEEVLKRVDMLWLPYKIYNKIYRWLNKIKPTYIQMCGVCGHCQSENITGMRTYEGRQAFLNNSDCDIGFQRTPDGTR